MSSGPTRTCVHERLRRQRREGLVEAQHHRRGDADGREQLELLGQADEGRRALVGRSS